MKKEKQVKGDKQPKKRGPKPGHGGAPRRAKTVMLRARVTPEAEKALKEKAEAEGVEVGAYLSALFGHPKWPRKPKDKGSALNLAGCCEAMDGVSSIGKNY